MTAEANIKHEDLLHKLIREWEEVQTNSMPVLPVSKRLSTGMPFLLTVLHFSTWLKPFITGRQLPSRPNSARLGVLYLDQISSQQLRLPSRDAVVQHLPPLAQADLHDVMLDRCCVIGRRHPGEQDSLLCPIGCEAPWWGKQHQWFRGTCRKYWEGHTGSWGGLGEVLNTDTRTAIPAANQIVPHSRTDTSEAAFLWLG